MRRNVSRPDAENPEWTAEEIRTARLLLEVLPVETVEAIRRHRGRRGPQKAPTKELISLRIDRDVVDRLRSTGPGWQTRANEALRAYAATVRVGRLPGVNHQRTTADKRRGRA